MTTKKPQKLQAFFEKEAKFEESKIRDIPISVPPVFMDFFEPKEFKVAYGGRGSGKSWFFAQYCIIRAMEKKVRIVCTRRFQNSIEESVYQLLCDTIARMGVEKNFKITDTYILCLITGSKIVFKGLAINASEIKSFEGADICWVEEAQNVSRNVWEVLIPTIRKEGSEILISFNPDLKDDATYQDFVINPQPNSIVKEVNYYDNPWFSEKLRTQMEHVKANDYAAYEHIWLGKPKVFSDAQVFKDKYEIAQFEPPQGVRFLHGADWGFAKDPCTLIRMYVIDNTLYIYKEIYAKHFDIEQLPALYLTLPNIKNFEILADGSRPETISYMRNKGFWIRAAKKWGGSVQDGVTIMRGFDKIIIHEDCVHTAEEMRLYSYKVDKNNGEIYPILVDQHNHCIDAIRYGLDKHIRGKRPMMIKG